MPWRCPSYERSRFSEPTMHLAVELSGEVGGRLGEKPFDKLKGIATWFPLTGLDWSRFCCQILAYLGTFHHRDQRWNTAIGIQQNTVGVCVHVFFIQKLDIISKEANATFWLKNRVLPSRPTVSEWDIFVRWSLCLSPDLWHSMLIILILLIHATTRQQWNASWQSKRRRSAQILSTAIVTVAPRNSNGNETGRDVTRRASLPCARVKTVKHSKLHIRFSVDRVSVSVLYTGMDVTQSKITWCAQTNPQTTIKSPPRPYIGTKYC